MPAAVVDAFTIAVKQTATVSPTWTAGMIVVFPAAVMTATFPAVVPTRKARAMTPGFIV